MKKVSYDRRAYESVDDRIPILGSISKTDRKKGFGL